MKLTRQTVSALIQSNRPVKGHPRPRGSGVESRSGVTPPRDSVSISSLAKSFASTQKLLSDHIREESEFAFSEEDLAFPQVAGIDLSPEGIAETLDDAIGVLYERFSEVHPNLNAAERNQRFESKIRAGIDGGYDRAVGILDGLDTPESVRAFSRETKERIDAKLESFLDSIRKIETADDAPKEEAAEDASADPTIHAA